MLTGSAILTFNSGVSLTMDAKWSLSSDNPVNVAQGGFGPIDITQGRGETHQIQVQFWCQTNGFEMDFDAMMRTKFDVEFIEGEAALGGKRARYGPCLMSKKNLNVDNAGGIVYATGTLIALRKKR